MEVSLDSSLDSDSFKRISTRRSSSIFPPFEEHRNVVGNFSTKFSMSSFVKKVEELTDNQRTGIERVGFGNVLKVPHHTLRKNLLVEWMERWDCEKQAFLLLDKELTISPIDAALILGLHVTGHPVSLNKDEPFSDLEEEYGAASSNRKISVSAIERRLESLGDSADEDFIRTFLLFTFGTLLFHNSTSKIDSRYLSLLKDLEKVSDYAWGAAVVQDLFNWLSRWKEEQAKNMEGCLLLLQIWSYEHLDIGRPNLLDYSLGFPRACRWESSRCNIPRNWFASKFNELEENQVMWKLRVTATELDIDVVKQSTETETGVKEVRTLPNPISIPTASDVSTTTTTSTRCTMLPPKSTRQLAAMHKEAKKDIGRSKPDIRDDISENSRLSEDISEITVEFTECSSSFYKQEVQEDQIAETSRYVKEDYQVLKTENLKLKEEMAELRRENAMLRNQLSLNPTLEEEVTKLRKEVAELKEENQHLRLPAIFADQVEKTILEYFNEVQDASHEKEFIVS